MEKETLRNIMKLAWELYRTDCLPTENFGTCLKRSWKMIRQGMEDVKAWKERIGQLPTDGTFCVIRIDSYNKGQRKVDTDGVRRIAIFGE